MSTELVSHAREVELTRFGTSNGLAVAVSQPRFFKTKLTCLNEFFDTIHLDKGQAAALAADLLDFAQGREEEIGT